jgi:UDP:flavonoid glycosyltransferase YjiC (YdhE family)
VRVLFSSTSGYGHIYPLLPLAKAFLAAGHEVLWATGAADVVAAAGIETAVAGLVGPELRDAVAPVAAAAARLPPPDRAAFMFPTMFGGLLTPPMVADLLPLAQRWQPDLLVHEQAELASPLVAALLGRPSLTHAFGGAVPAPFVAEAGQRLAALWAGHGLAVPPHAGCFTAPYLDICPPSVQSVPTAHIAQVQPLRPVADVGGDRADLAGVPADDGRPLVYVTLGTIHNHAAFLRPLVEALAALPVRLLVTVGKDADPALLGDQPPNVRVERWVDQPLVLGHCALVVSHGGSGTFLGALAQGLPQLCLPQAADQFRNAQAGVSSGAALSLPPGWAPADAVPAVQRLLADGRFRSNATKVSAEIAGMPSPGDVVETLVRWRTEGPGDRALQ